MQLDAELIRQALRGDRGAFQTVTEQTWSVVFIYIQQRIRDTERARDLTQDTFLQAYEKRSTLRDAESFFAWLLTIASNKTIDALRRRKARPERAAEPLTLAMVPDRRDASESALDRQEEDARISEALGSMDDRYRTVLILRYWSGLTPAQISRLLQEPEGTIRNRIFRAHERLRAVLESGTSRARESRKQSCMTDPGTPSSRAATACSGPDNLNSAT